MRHLLFISYLFPPMGGVGVQRALKFVKYLPDFGWTPHVLTVQPRKAGLHDEGLEKEIPPQVSITRTKALLLPQRMPWCLREWITRWLLTVDEQVGWEPFAVSAGLRILHDYPIEMIFSTSAPYTAHLIARRLHQQSGLPWVADFRDPWVGNANLHFPTSLHRSSVERREREVVQEASRVLVVSQPMAQSFCSRIPEVDPSKISWLPNGFDAEDFTKAQPAKRDKDRFYLVYTGSFYAQGRTSRAMLEAVQAIISKGQIPRDRLRLRLVGNIGKDTQRWVAELGLDDIVEMPGYVPHEQSIAYLLGADVLLLIIGSSPDSSAIFTGKIFEYLATAKPILCLANNGVASDLIRKSRAGIIVSPEDVSQIAQALVKMYSRWQEGKLEVEPDQQMIQTFDRRQLTQQLAGIFDQLVKQGQP
jgi:glycosyltransferase involved in cell wall biosynthesis